MENHKSGLKSKTIVSALFGAGITVGLMVGVVTQSEAEGINALLAEITPLIVQLLAFVGAIYGRIKAKAVIK